MIDPQQFLDEIIRPTLRDMSMHSTSAERLLLGTAMAESNLQYLRQIGGGPAVGLFQIEPATARDVLRRYLDRRQDLNARLCASFRLASDPPTIDWRRVSDADIEDALIGDARFSCAVARLRYYMAPSPLPAADDFDGLGRYWKDIYNTAGGAGDPAKVADILRRVCRRLV